MHAAFTYTFPYVSPPGVLGHDDLVHQVFADHRVCLSLPRPPSALTLTLPRYSSVGFHPSSALLSYGEPTVSRPNAQQFMKGNSKVKITILFYKLTIGITPLLPLFARQHHALHTIRLNAFSLLVPLATSLVVCFTKLYAAPHRTTNATSSFSPLHSFMACRRVRSLTSLCTPCFWLSRPPVPAPLFFRSPLSRTSSGQSTALKRLLVRRTMACLPCYSQIHRRCVHILVLAYRSPPFCVHFPPHSLRQRMKRCDPPIPSCLADTHTHAHTHTHTPTHAHSSPRQ